MKVTFVSNFMNHHQLPFSQELAGPPGVDYPFISREGIPASRLALGYEDLDHRYPFVLCPYDGPEAARRAETCLEESDVVIVGSAPTAILARRLRQGKLTFQYSERFFKREDGGLKRYLKDRYRAWKHFVRFQGKPLYFLCSSAYTAADIARYADYTGKVFRWGYFPQAVRWPSTEALLAAKEPATLLWAGRLLDWKHPEQAVEVARRLREAGIPFRLDVVGNGPEENALHRQVIEAGLQDCVKLLGALPAAEVRAHMEKAAIFLFTSDKQEGWGAVLNEAMNSGCAVAASHGAGAAPYLIQDGVNGLLYQSKNTDALYGAVKTLLEDPAMAARMGAAAYRTITDTWNAELAARRFVALAKALLAGGPPPVYPDGPCSPAPCLADDWYPPATRDEA